MRVRDAFRERNASLTRISRLHLAEQMMEAAAHLEGFVASLEVHDRIAAQVAADLLDGRNAHDRRPMDLPELLGVELEHELLDGLADQRLVARRLHARVL